MATIKNYHNVIASIVKEVYLLFPPSKDIDYQLIMDEKRGHYLIYAVGWKGQEWVYDSYLHIDIKPNGKVWLQHDGTDLRIGQQMIEQGIKKSDIVVGFQPPFARTQMQGFAIA
jgi:XisI protein